ncbi:MAG: phosphodiester glycosidase family protein [Pyramidobacter sp.]
MFLKRTAAALAVFLFASGTAFADVPRGKVLGELMRVLDLPLKTGRSFVDVDETTPYGPALDSALSLGILYPADDFSPEIICTNAETLMFALQAMGFRHEAEISRWALPPEDERLPQYISGYVALAKSVTPAAPADVTASPWGSTTEEQLEEVLEWAEECRENIVWNREIRRPEGTLTIHREKVGRPPQGWRVMLGIYDTAEKATAAAEKVHASVPFTVIPLDTSYAVASPLAADRSEAWKIARSTGRHDFSATILPESGESEALFWVSFTPADNGDAVIRGSHAGSGWKLKKLSAIAAGSNALAAINGGYFSSAGPIGTLFSDGQPMTLPYYNRSMAAWNSKGRLCFSGGEFRTRLQINDGPWITVLLNSLGGVGQTSILTASMGKSQSRAGNNGTVARVHDGLVQEAVPALMYNRDMDDGDWLIVTRDPDVTIRRGDRVRLKNEWREQPPFEVGTAVQAGPLLYAPGRQYWDEMINEKVITMRHPRTLIGQKGKKMVWLVVDGRSSWHSQGLTLEEAADLGRRLGLTALLNLDGGGSSEMWWDGNVVNRVSDGRERSMPYGIMVLKKTASE